MAVSAGGAVLQVTPQLVKTFSRDLTNQLAGPAVKTANKAGTDAGRQFGSKFGTQMAGPIRTSSEKAGQDAGKKTGLRFSSGLRTGIGPIRGIMRGFGPGLATAFGATALIAGIKGVTDEAREAAVVGRITEARLKSTGGVANVTAGQVSGLAERLSNLTGVDDEIIQSGENLMLTFSGVRNEAGKGNDIFDRATKLSLDLAAGMNNGAITANGLKTANIQLGKALEDPIKGISALRRSGVSFTEQEKAQIKALVEHGDKLGAQKVILEAVGRQFGGTAAASADAGKRFSTFVANMKEKIGTVLLPILNNVLQFLVDKLPGAFSAIGGVLGKVAGWFKRTGDTIRGILAPALASIGKSIAPAAAAFTKSLLPGLKSLWHVVQAQVLPAIKILAAIIGVALFAALKYVLPLLLRIAGPVLGFFFKQLGQTIQWISNLIRWIGRVGAWLLRWITGTKTTGEAVKELGRRVGVFATNMTKQWQAITKTVGNALSGLRRTTITVLSAMIRFWLRWAGSIIDAAATALGWIPGIGPKIRTAQAKFHEFARSVNASLDRIKDKNVHVNATASIHTTANTRQALNALGIKGYGTKFLAAGGPVQGPGGPTADRVPAMLSAGEHVWTAKEVAKAGGHQAVEGMRQQVVRGYAGGGPVLNVATNTGRRTNAAEVFLAKAVEATRRISQPVATKLAEGLGKGLSKLMDKASMGGKAGIKNFIKAVDSHPYVWGGVGPGGYDCSGLVGEVYARHTGKRSYHRYFTTSTIGGMGFARGPGGTLQIGVNPGHHMAGRYGGLGFEAESTATGIKIGSAASPPGSFAVQYHLAKGGAVEAVKQLAGIPGFDIGGDPSGTWLRRGTRGAEVDIFDRGGWLQPGQLGLNRTSTPERVVGPREQLVDEDRLAKKIALAMAANPVRAYMDPNQARHAIQVVQGRSGVKPANQLK